MYIMLTDYVTSRHVIPPRAKRSPRGNRDSECCRERIESKITNASAIINCTWGGRERARQIFLCKTLSLSLCVCLFVRDDQVCPPLLDRNETGTRKRKGGRRQSRFDRSIDGYKIIGIFCAKVLSLLLSLSLPRDRHATCKQSLTAVSLDTASSV